MSNYPPGMTSSDWDHVEGPLTEDDATEACPSCQQWTLTVTTWRTRPTLVTCSNCAYEREEGH